MLGGGNTRARRRGPRRALAVAVAMLGCALLTGACSSGSSAGSAVVTPSVTPTPTPSPSPAFPAGAGKATRTGAEVFAKHWFAVYNHATWTRNPAGVRALSDGGCNFCTQAGVTVENLATNGRFATGGKITLTNIKIAGTPAKGMRLDVLYDQLPSQILGSEGAVLSTNPAVVSARMVVATKWTGKKWVMLEILV